MKNKISLYICDNKHRPVIFYLRVEISTANDTLPAGEPTAKIINHRSATLSRLKSGRL